MRRNSSLHVLTAVAALTISVAHAQTPKELPAAEIALHGDGHAVPPCSSCHGQAGEGNSAAGFPRLAGLPNSYLAAQLDALAEGVRHSPVMEPVVRALSARQRVQLARYYSTLTPSPVLGVAPAGALDNQLALQGRWSDGIPACVKCHGEGGSGVGQRFPPLAGQSSLYLANQLRAWKLGTRQGDPLGLMRAVANRLSDQDIRSVSAYFAAQPVINESGAQP
jgi:cytochrome c553